MTISALLLGLSLFALRRFGHARWLSGLLPLCLLAVVTLTGVELGLSRITGEGVNGAVFYHLKTGLGGGDISQYGGTIFVVVVGIVAVGTLLWRARRIIRPGSETRRPGADPIIAGLAVLALVVHPVSLASAQYALRFSLVEQQDDGFIVPRRDAAGPETPRNLVILYLESVERTYLDPDRFPGLMPNLSRLEKSAISFGNLGQTAGSGFTIGGMVATQCGVPLILSGGANSMRVNRFLSGATCLGDILEEAGYTLSYLGGASTEFAGKGAFYRSHGFDDVTGLDEVLPGLSEPDYLAEWGLQDDTLFDLARDRFERLASRDTPFALALLTLDTHHPNGHADTNRACGDLVYGDGTNPMLNSVHCADRLAGAFVDEILSGPNAKDTVIAVMSDHLALVNTATGLLEDGPRRNLMMILDGSRDVEPSFVERPGTTLDVAPTLLSHLGFDVPRMGLGANLLGAEKTFPEELGIEADDRGALDAHVMGYQSVYTRLWAFPDLSNGAYVNAERGEISFGHNAFRTPVLLTFDGDNAIDSATLGDARADETLVEATLSLADGARYLWVDDCRALGTGGPTALPARLCALAGVRGEPPGLRTFEGSGFASEEDLVSWLDPETPPDTSASDTEMLEEIGRVLGDLPIEVSLAGLETGARGVVIQSSAFGAGASFVRRQTTDSLAAGEDWGLGRGVTLVGIGADGRGEVLDRLDQCNPAFEATGHIPWAEQIGTGSERFVGHVIAVHDTAFCGSSAEPLEPVLSGLALPDLKAAKMREAYVALIDAEGGIQEFPNRDFDRRRLHLRPGIGLDRKETPDRTPEASPQKSDVIKAASVAAVAGIAETEGCTAPAKIGSLAVEAKLRVGNRLDGAEMAEAVGFGPGWWAEEPAGRWSGARAAEIAVVLPAEERDVTLSLGFATSGQTARRIRVSHEGIILGEGELRASGRLSIDAGDLPRERPVVLTVESGGPNLDCPASRSAGGDTRQLGVMLKSISVERGSGPSGIVQASLPVQVRPEAPSPSKGCVSAPVADVVAPPTTPLPLERVLPASAAVREGHASFGDGWWAVEEFGAWSGRRSATFDIILPEAAEELFLELSLAPFGSEALDLSLLYEGREITLHRTYANRPLRADVSALPRGTPVSLTVEMPDAAELTCPSARGAETDNRALGVMVQAMRLSTAGGRPFTGSIGHGGGRLGGATITNSFDAIGSNLSRFTVFEIDFNWTSDGELICLHDWQESFAARFGAPITDPIDHESFRDLLAATPERPRNCDLDGLAGWMRANPDIRIVTDVKERPAEAHKLIANRHPDLLSQFVPQAYQPEEIDAYRALGFASVIWTLYRYGSDIDAVLRETSERRPAALTMPLSMADEGLLGALRRATDVPIYVHTINDPDTAACLLAAGAAGIYSDDLGDADVSRLRATAATCT